MVPGAGIEPATRGFSIGWCALRIQGVNSKSIGKRVFEKTADFRALENAEAAPGREQAGAAGRP
jgi:hypothetical protein